MSSRLIGPVRPGIKEGLFCGLKRVRISPRWGLNPRPPVYKTGALPLSYEGAVFVRRQRRTTMEPFAMVQSTTAITKTPSKRI